ncbi:ATP-binding cassette domain-containing protein [Paenibacillus sp. ACRRX]|uniref:ATP-binding cassette domain-containing protein n=1 Tax=Paenibacillus sp. ACRRX TaxID=2918206 RepID=UPI001EF43457|nr:ATP-binding cassette domain-containing protein [Paenibacillus sp. ACRRX]MCG7408128.1 ATP-binding cassette domain-containing protein [Paenibacillus sp. ACRRX]
MAIVTCEQISYQYSKAGSHQPLALIDVSLRLEQGKFYAILGATGSGKSTLLQHFNGIYQPTKGKLQVYDVVFAAGAKVKGLKPLRSRVGLVFQFPEQQLFEETVEKDLMFGPIQFGENEEQAREAAVAALRAVGLDETFMARSPFELSGGQMRKVAIATVLASNPELIVLDEPTATLDPVSRTELIALLKRLCEEQGRTIVMVTHRLDEVLTAADEFILMKQGTVTYAGTHADLMRSPHLLQAAGIVVPSEMKLAHEVSKRTGIMVDELPSGIEGWADWLIHNSGATSGAADREANDNTVGQQEPPEMVSPHGMTDSYEKGE